MIRKCSSKDEQAILSIINESAKAYCGVIPDDRYKEPYMTPEELRSEMGEMTFFGYEEEGSLTGVAGYQPVQDVTLVRHLYVHPQHQKKGIGEQLLRHVIQTATTSQILVGTWEAADWAISFYKKRGFKLSSNKEALLRTYWRIPQRQIETSVVLEMSKQA